GVRRATRWPAGGRRGARHSRRPAGRACRSREPAGPSRPPAPARATRLGLARRGTRRGASSRGTNGEPVDDLAQDARVRVDRVESFARPLRGVIRVLACAVDAVRDDVAVAVEDVVDDLEQEPELVTESAPRRLSVDGNPSDPE